MPTTARARRSVSPRVPIHRTSSRRAGAVTIFFEAPLWSLRSPAAHRPATSSAARSPLPEPSGVWRRRCPCHRLAPPEVVTCLREPVLAAQLLQRDALISFPQESDNLLFRKSLLHVQPPGRG